jgi:glycosyltransferase involved in cell wall biosynthesis
MESPEVSVVIPLRDEAPNVLLLHEQLTAALAPLEVSYELILVDDGSEDDTFSHLIRLCSQDRHVRVVQFTRDFGQTAAFAAGFAHARGRLIVTFDGDLQNDPADIPRLLSLASNYDIVCGWRKNRQDALLTRHVPSVVANWLIGVVTGIPIHDNGCSLKVFRAEVVKPLTLTPGMHRYLPALASQLGGRVTEVVVNHRSRQFGRSNYGLSRTFGVLRDIVRMRRLMRQAIDPVEPKPRLYEVLQVCEGSAVDAAHASSRQVEGEGGVRLASDAVQEPSGNPRRQADDQGDRRLQSDR